MRYPPIPRWAIPRWLLLLTVLLAGVPAQTQAQTQAQAQPQQLGSFTTQQRQEIIAIIRDALRTDPSLLRDLYVVAGEERRADLRQDFLRPGIVPVGGCCDHDRTTRQGYGASG